ncbi:MAG: FAD-dependent oxidoreductase [Candidatus Brocadiales bacterium]|nr:FAD-dependent oxidoreductase [Candidatus Brocadiales bacterium]
MKKKILVLGGGPCGLSAAWELSKYGYGITVIEKESRVGGLCITNEYKGYRFDLGGHRFISKNKELVENVCGIMGDELLTSHRKSVILLKGKTFEYPLSAKDIFLKMDIWTNMKAFTSYLIAVFTKIVFRKKDVSFEDWIVNRFGRTLYNLFFGPYTEKLWGVSPKFISSDWASQRISLLNLKDVLFRLLKLKKGTPRTYAKGYFYPKKGIGQMFDIMSEEISKMGGKIVLNATVSGIKVNNNAIESICYVQRGVTRAVDCDAIISTIPLPDLIKTFPGHLTEDVMKHASVLQFRAVRFLNILVDIPDISDNTWMYVSEGKHIMTRIQEPKRRSPFSTPEGKTSVMLEIPCNENDETWSCSKEILLNRCLADLKELGLDIRDKVIDYFTTCVTHGYPVYSLDYSMHRQKLFDFLDCFENLITCGRQGTFRYIFMDTAMEMGIAAAQTLMLDNLCKKEDVQLMRSEKELIEVTSVTA